MEADRLGESRSSVKTERVMEHESSEQKKDTVQAEETTKTLRELYDLLQQYAPGWYTRQHQLKAEAALGIRRQSVVDFLSIWRRLKLDFWDLFFGVLAIAGLARLAYLIWSSR